MIDVPSFAARIRERFPLGLTAVLAVGGTRTTYMMDRNRQAADPGKIDYRQYGEDMLARIQSLLRDYFDLGGQNVVIPVLSYQSVENLRGEAYAERTALIARELMNDQWVAYFRELDIDPYFVGIDTLLRFPDKPTYYALGQDCARFNRAWSYQEGRRKLVFEIAPIPLFSIWRAHEVLGPERMAQAEAQLESASNLEAVHDILYRYYAQALYGVELPVADFYLGTSRNGDLKLRAMLPISLLCGSATRFYYTPYPTMLISREGLQAIFEDLAFGRRLQSSQIDYSGKMTAELLESEYERVQQLIADPNSTVGLLRTIE
ncbi:MAG: hypothetical protein U0452_14395 [Anaerolineae bacterium]